MKEIFKYGLILFAVCALAAGSLSLVYEKTRPVIEQRRSEETNQAAQEVLPAARSFEAEEGIKVGYDRENQPVGKVVEAETTGYSGPIKLLVGISQDGKITGVKVLKHAETPGLGAKIEEAWFAEQFIGKTKVNLMLEKDSPEGEIDAITGATISSRAVIDAVRKAFFETTN